MSPSLFIFDKDGTLIDFNFMWATWVTGLAHRLERAAQHPLAHALYQAIGFDGANNRVLPGSPLAIHSMAELRERTARIAREAGLSFKEAERAVSEAWFVPDPIVSARPIADLPRIFSALRSRHILTAVATSDDRVPTTATLEALGIASLVNLVVCADEGMPNKPEPDMLLHVCHSLSIRPSNAAMVGDSVADMQAAQAAGIGLRIGVLSGLASREMLEPCCDAVIPDVSVLVAGD